MSSGDVDRFGLSIRCIISSCCRTVKIWDLRKGNDGEPLASLTPSFGTDYIGMYLITYRLLVSKNIARVCDINL